MIAALLLAFAYVALSVGRVPGLRSDRLAACIVAAVLAVSLRVITLREAQASVDAATIGLLFGMMVLSASLEISGAFALLGDFVTRRARGPLGLLVGVAVASAVLSALFINDVVCIAFTPLVLHVTERLERNPRPYLLALATSSNIGSSATITGNPQNILIGSLSHVSYGRFVATLAPVAIVALAVNVAVIRWVFRADFREPLPKREPGKPPRVYRRWVRKSGVVIAAVVVAFACGAPPVVAALLGASAMLVTRAVDPKRLYVRVDWPLLALFVALFVVVAGAEKAGLAAWALRALRPLHPETVVGLTTIAAALSNLVSNVPAVMVLKSVVPALPHARTAWLTLAMASTLGGNLTLPGSIASIIVVERSKSVARISWWDFCKVGVPSALGSLALGAAWLAIVG